MNNLKYIFFDFGGTLDLDGLHWYRHWLASYKRAEIEVKEEIFKKAYFEAEDILNNMPALTCRYSELIKLKCQIQIKNIFAGEISESEFYNLTDSLVDATFAPIAEQAKKTKALLAKLSEKYKIGVISNFYGNLSASLEELKLYDLVDLIIDSKRVGTRKPGEEIYRLALEKAGITSQEAAMVGDSYRQDIVPTKSIGMTTFMIDCPQPGEPEGTLHTSADYLIKSIEDLNNIL